MKLFRKKKQKETKNPNLIGGHMVWKDQSFYKAARDKYESTVPGIPEIRCYFLQSAIRSLSGIEGDLAECGVREGKSSLYMLEADLRKREYFLFDSFEGLSDPDPAVDELDSAYKKGSFIRRFATDIDVVKGRFKNFSNVNFMPGWIPERFSEVKDRRFALIHVDVDLFQPTWDALAFFYPRLVAGGMLICDDYGTSMFPGARKAMDSFFADKSEKPVELPQGQSFIVRHGALQN